MTKKTALIYGAGGFIGSHMAKRLKSEGYWVRGVDVKYPEFGAIKHIDHFILRDLRDPVSVKETINYAGCNRNPHQSFAMQFDKPFDEIYQFAADMGGAGYIFTGDNDANIMHNSATINLNLLDSLIKHHAYLKKSSSYKETYGISPEYPKVFYSSSACIYPGYNQVDPYNPDCRESTAYPAEPDSEYGWEKLFSERLYAAYNKNYHIPVRIGRFHNIYGPEGTWEGGREKAPAAICRKVISSIDDNIEIWGAGTQTRSFLYISDCIDAVRLMMNSNHMGPMNIGSEEIITINDLVDMVCDIGNKSLAKIHIPGPVGVNGRNSHNGMIEACLGWKPKYTLKEGIALTYVWIEKQIREKYS